MVHITSMDTTYTTEQIKAHSLLAQRAARPGFASYVYSKTDLDEIVAELWANAADKGGASDAIQAACMGVSSRDMSDAIARLQQSRRTTTMAMAAPVAAAAARKITASACWCRRCGGPVADGSSLCGEC
jgi:hypothetical protein